MTQQKSSEIHLPSPEARIAYFSLEFGFSQSMHQYAGGLGILAGDHLKSASDLGLPLIGMGLLYHEGSPHQKLNASGKQIDVFEHIPLHALPLKPVLDACGKPLMIEVAFPEGDAIVKIHEAKIGCISLFLLDTFHEENAHDVTLMHITDRLYFGDREHRLKQEILLGIGGMKALEAMKCKPNMIHINEGHSAFALTEYIGQEMRASNQSFWQIKETNAHRLLFTTHTPVSAGNEVFTNDLIRQYLINHCKDLSISMDEFLELGASSTAESHLFSMSAFALHLAGVSNAVSALHGEIAREMWKDLKKSSSNITSITNGIHTQSWIGTHIADLFDKHIGNAWRENPDSASSWDDVMELPSGELLYAHQSQKQSMISYLKSRISNMNKDFAFDSDGFFIGYARRFALYKRAYLPFMDIEALKRILNHASGKVYLIIAGKAHPDDHEAKALIEHIHGLIHEHDLTASVIMFEDYDIDLAKAMIQGCDIWLNTPRRPLEASGTSGMKASLNGCVHCSISDGWWDEAYSQNVGFIIPHVQNPISHEEQDRMESNALYALLEHEILPRYFSRYITEDWSRLMKSSIRYLAPRFSSNRMVREYAERFYIPGIMKK